MHSIKSDARRAGLIYLLLAITGAFSLFYMSGAFIVPGDATATARNITAAPLMYRVGVLSGLASDVIFLWLALSLYDLLKDVDRKQARLMVILVTAGSAVALADLINQMAPLVLLSGADFLSPFSKPQLDALAMAFLRLHSQGTYVEMAFWALWLWPFGLLVIRSGFFPKLLGVLLIVGCAAYLAVSVTSIVLPAYSRGVSLIAMPFFMVGELSMIVWLLVKGARET
ncbi:MAG TPA: DUF4386 domain-containing protein [Vicinamibacterales bacterium]|nr:DUF4386 domain-containing protein [Vicinamibacterales bacterium]